MAAAGVGFSWPSKIARMPNSIPSSSPSRSSTCRVVKMAVFLDEKQKTLSLKKPEEAFNAAKDKIRCPARRSPSRAVWSTKCSSTCSFIGVITPPGIELSAENGVTQFLNIDVLETSRTASEFMHRLVLADLDPATAKLAIGFLGPFLSAFGFLFILRIVMSWYPKLPVEKFPYVLAFAPTEPLLSPTRKLIPPLAGVDVTPVVWFGLISFLNEILVGPQGLLVLLSQQV
ncbi:hypothetical protein Vadar_034493 [Vaccinium darrowii]|uniref:Uncharacterized protein n=1 Tax=Vaccinium darrowii TaxID=229202 RepID=A0ACB7XED3_9ERIC|nr:hypothetical protein Vadar_034493 [Vaccinium darrowii]